MSKGPGEGGSERSNDEGGVHSSYGWNDGDGVNHRESYDTDSEGNVKNYHYVQSDDDGSKMVYNYHTGEWEDKS